MHEQQLLAAGTDWMQTVVALVFVGIVVLSSVAQTIIAKMRGQQEDTSNENQSGPRVPQPRAPQFPTARPMPRPGRPTETAYPRVPTPQARPRPAPPRPVATQPPFARPQPQRAPQPPHAPQPPRAPQPPAPRPVEVRFEPPPPPKPTPKRRTKQPATRTPAVAKAADEPLARHHLELSTDVAHPHTELDALVLGESDDPIRHPTRDDLRYAILMNEVLGPPVSLRPLDERF